MTERRIYRPPWRIDLTVRQGVSRPLPAAELVRVAGRALDATAAGIIGAADDPRWGRVPCASLAIILADDRELADLNERYMGAAGPTDVLSFPLLPAHAFPHHESRDPDRVAGAPPVEATFALPPGARLHLGDIVVSVERAIAQAEEGRGGWTSDVSWSAGDELRLLVVHGTLHVCGWDHADPDERSAMRLLEAAILGVDPPR